MRNKVQLIGNLGKDPEIMEFDGGKKMARFSIATQDVYRRQNGEQVKETHWHNVVAWGKLAESVGERLAKGSEVAVEGKLQTRTWEDKEGQRKSVTEVQMADYLIIRGRKLEA